MFSGQVDFLRKPRGPPCGWKSRLEGLYVSEALVWLHKASERFGCNRTLRKDRPSTIIWLSICARNLLESRIMIDGRVCIQGTYRPGCSHSREESRFTPGGPRPFLQKSTYTTRSIFGLDVVQTWSQGGHVASESRGAKFAYSTVWVAHTHEGIILRDSRAFTWKSRGKSGFDRLMNAIFARQPSENSEGTHERKRARERERERVTASERARKRARASERARKSESESERERERERTRDCPYSLR